MRSHGGKSGAGRGFGRGMKTRKRVGRRPGCGAENFSAGRARKRRFSGAGTTAAARKICRWGSGIPAAVRTIRQLAGRCFGGVAENMAGTVTVPAAGNLSAGLRPCPKLPLPPPSGDGSYSASVKAMPCSASSE